MKKSWIKRKIFDDGVKTEDIMGYKFCYNDIYYGVYNCKEYNCQFHKGYIPVLMCSNEECNGLSLINYNFRTIKECNEEVMKIIDKKKELILQRIKEV